MKMVFSVLQHVALMVEAASASEKTTDFYQITRRNNTEDSTLWKHQILQMLELQPLSTSAVSRHNIR